MGVMNHARKGRGTYRAADVVLVARSNARVDLSAASQQDWRSRSRVCWWLSQSFENSANDSRHPVRCGWERRSSRLAVSTLCLEWLDMRCCFSGTCSYTLLRRYQAHRDSCQRCTGRHGKRLVALPTC